MTWNFAQSSATNKIIGASSLWDVPTPLRAEKFSAPLVLARILEGGKESGVLSDVILRNGETVKRRNGDSPIPPFADSPFPSLQSAIDSLTSEQNKILSAQVGDYLPEFLALSEQNNSEIFYTELFELGRELENSDHLEMAKNVYAFLSTSLAPSEGRGNPMWLPNSGGAELSGEIFHGGDAERAATWGPPLREKAQERLEILQGGGSVAAQIDFSGRRMVGRILEPSGFVGMGLGLGVSKFAEAAVFSRLTAIANSGAPTLIPKILTSGLGKRLTAGVAAFMTEVPSFALGGKVTRSLLGKTEDYSLQALKSELISNALFLGGMKTFGIAGSMATRGIASPFQAAALRQASTLLGIMTGHLLEIKAGYKELQKPAHFLVDSLVTLLDLHVMGEVSNGFYGARFKAFQQRMAEGVKETANRGNGESVGRLQDLKSMWNNLGNGQFATVNGAPLPQPRTSPAKSVFDFQNLFIKDTKDHLRDRTTNPATPAAISLPPDVLESVTEHQFPDSLVSHFKISYDKSGKIGELVISKTQFAEDEEKFAIVVPRLMHMKKLSRVGTSHGTYTGWLCNLATYEIAYNKLTGTFEKLLAFVHDGGPIIEYEKIIAEALPVPRLRYLPQFLPRFLKAKNPHFDRVNTLPLSKSAKAVLWNWLITQKTREDSPYFVPETELLDNLAAYLTDPVRQDRIEKVIREAGKSPLGIVRLLRLNLLLQSKDGFINSKLGELGDPNFHLDGPKPTPLPAKADKAQLLNTQFDAYLGDPKVVEVLYTYADSAPQLLDPKMVEKNFQRRNAILDDFFKNRTRQGPWVAEDVIEVFNKLGDEISNKVAAAISENGEVEYILKDGKDFEDFVANIPNSIMDGKTHQALYIPSGRLGSKPVLLMRRPAVGLGGRSPEHNFFKLLQNSVHEYRHYEDIKPNQRRNLEDHLRAETMAYGVDSVWAAIHGDIEDLEASFRKSHAGYALTFRDNFELDCFTGLFKERDLGELKEKGK